MSLLLDLLLAIVAFLGHFALAVWLFNRLHAVPWPVKRIKILERLLLLVAAAIAIAFAVHILLAGGLFFAAPGWNLWKLYGAWSLVMAGLAVPLWVLPKLRERVPAALLANETQVIDVEIKLGYAPIAGTQARMLARFPGNEYLRLSVHRKELRIPGLPPALEGLSIAHLSDLHMLGNLTEAFYAEVMAATQDLAPDVICITGDILEHPDCLPWIPRTLGRLTAPEGRYFIIGNHEKRLPAPQPLREAMAAAGYVDLGSRTELVRFRGESVWLSGSELPWFGSQPPPPADDASTTDERRLRILLSHSPDQFPFAVQHGYDLMLAGHTHGGQICLPGIGALIAPSWYGWRYAGGTYDLGPTIMHVSRGISGKQSIRLRCPPEIALLVLRS
jgi:predicted MPP superfamily phosphohydrolase